jgi:hypothetical protein
MFQGGAPAPFSQTAPYSQKTPSRWQPAPQTQAPMDILGLADKAASAVQALASQHKYQMPPGAAFPQNAQAQFANQHQYRAFPTPTSAAPHSVAAAPPYNMSEMYGQAPGVPNENIASDKGLRRRTTAGIEELTVMVQYAVQVRLNSCQTLSWTLHTNPHPFFYFSRIFKPQRRLTVLSMRVC